MTDEHKLLLDAVHRGFKSGDGTAALVYADYCEENAEGCPEFFRLMGRRLRGETDPEWNVVVTTTSVTGGGTWYSGTAANPRIYRSLGDAAMLSDHKIRQHRSWLGLTPAVAHAVGLSQEMADYRHMFRGNFDSAKELDRILCSYNLTHMLYGARLWVFDQGALPDDYAVLIDEAAKAMCVFTECI